MPGSESADHLAPAPHCWLQDTSDAQRHQSKPCSSTACALGREPGTQCVWCCSGYGVNIRVLAAWVWRGHQGLHQPPVALLTGPVSCSQEPGHDHLLSLLHNIKMCSRPAAPHERQGALSPTGVIRGEFVLWFTRKLGEDHGGNK